MSQYLTIASDYTTEVIIKKSRFIAHLKRIKSEDEALEFIARTKKEHNKANHNCYAFMLGDQDQIQRASDDGEPSGTAGVPILEVLKRNNIHDVCVIVTRYFGGVKLGAGGLIRAYAGTAATGVDEVGIVERLLMQNVTITLQYNQYDAIVYWLNQNDYPTPNVDYTDVVTLTLPVRLTDLNNFQMGINQLLNANITLVKGGEAFQEIPYHQ